MSEQFPNYTAKFDCSTVPRHATIWIEVQCITFVIHTYIDVP